MKIVFINNFINFNFHSNINLNVVIISFFKNHFLFIIIWHINYYFIAITNNLKKIINFISDFYNYYSLFAGY